MLNCFSTQFRGHKRTSTGYALLLVRTHVVCVSKPRNSKITTISTTKITIHIVKGKQHHHKEGRGGKHEGNTSVPGRARSIPPLSSPSQRRKGETAPPKEAAENQHRSMERGGWGYPSFSGSGLAFLLGVGSCLDSHVEDTLV